MFNGHEKFVLPTVKQSEAYMNKAREWNRTGNPSPNLRYHVPIYAVAEYLANCDGYTLYESGVSHTA